MTYYDNFELDCGCRMWCKCPKIRFCKFCNKKQIFEFLLGAFGCRECGRVER